MPFQLFQSNFLSVVNHDVLCHDRLDELQSYSSKLRQYHEMDLMFWNNWLLMALLTPALWAASCIIDVCFIGKGIFRYPSDGPIISGLFCLVPLVLFVPVIGGWEGVIYSMVWPALLAGLCYFLHLYFVFRALFTINDASCSETFNTLTVFFVPLMAFVILGERLAPIYYLAILLALAGILVLIRYYFSGEHRHAVALLTIAVLCMSLTMVLQAWVFEQMAYWNGIILFACGMFLTTLTVVVSQQRKQYRRIVGSCCRFGFIFLLAEVMQLLAVLSSQRATQIGPSVSFVAVVECSLPLFVILFSAALLQISRHWKMMSADVSDVLLLQMAATPVKLTSLVLILFAILLVQVRII